MWVVLPIGLSALVFYPIVRNYFFGDDLYNLYQIVNAPLATYLLTPYGGHLLVARNFVFYLCHQVFGTQAPGYFWLMLLTHLVNVALLYSLVRLLTESRRLAAFGAALWGSAALHEGSLGWYSVYGNVMVGTVTLWLLRDLARRAARQPLRTTTAWLWPVLLVLGATSFAVGLAVVLVFPVLVLGMHPGGPDKRRALLMSLVFAAAVVPAYFAVHRTMLTPEAAAVATSTLSAGTLDAWRAMVAMLADLAGYGMFLLLLREAGPRLGYSSAAGVALIAAFAFLCVFAALRGDRRTRGVLLGCLALTLATFGVVVVGRGVLWGTKFYLATRYQYVPLLGVVVCLCLALGAAEGRLALPSRLKTATLALWLVAALTIHLTLSRGINHHQQARRATEMTVSEMRRLVHEAPPGEDVYISNRMFHGVGPMLIRNPQMFPGWAAAFTVFFPSNVVEGRRVFFVEADADVRDAAKDGKRTSTLIVAN